MYEVTIFAEDEDLFDEDTEITEAVRTILVHDVFLSGTKQKNPIRIGLDCEKVKVKKKSICEPAKKGSCFRDAASYYIMLKDHDDIFSSELCPLINCA